MKHLTVTRLIVLAAVLVLSSSCLLAIEHKKHENLERMLGNDDVSSFSVCYPTKEKIISTNGDESLLIMAIENRATRFQGDSYLVSESGDHFFLEVSDSRRYNDLQIDRRFSERGSANDGRKTK